MSFLSTTSYPYAKMLARQLRAADAGVKLAFGGVFATLNAPLVKAQCREVDFVCRGDGEQLILDLLERLNDPEHGDRRDLAGEGRHGSQQSEPRASPAISTSGRSPTARACRSTSSSRCRSMSRPCFLSTASPRCRRRAAARGPASSATSRSSTRASGAREAPSPRDRGVRAAPEGWLRRRSTSSTTTSCSSPSASRRSATASTPTTTSDQVRARGPRRLGRTAPLPGDREVACRTLMFGIESGSQKMLDRLKKEQTLEEIEVRRRERESARASRSSTASSSSASPTRPRKTCGRRSSSPRSSRSTASASIACASTAARRSGTNTSSAAS